MKRQTVKREAYDERAKAGVEEKDEEANGEKGGVLFDVDAIRAEVAELAAEGFKIKELESTLPPMKLDISAPSLATPSPALRSSRSFNGSVDTSGKPEDKPSSFSRPQTNTGPPPPAYNSWDDYDKSAIGGLHSDGSIQMSFDTSYVDKRPAAKSFDLPRPPPREQWAPNPVEPGWSSVSNSLRPSLEKSKTAPSPSKPVNPLRNAWADDDDEFGGEKEMKMTFE